MLRCEPPPYFVSCNTTDSGDQRTVRLSVIGLGFWTPIEKRNVWAIPLLRLDQNNPAVGCQAIYCKLKKQEVKCFGTIEATFSFLGLSRFEYILRLHRQCCPPLFLGNGAESAILFSTTCTPPHLHINSDLETPCMLFCSSSCSLRLGSHSRSFCGSRQGLRTGSATLDFTSTLVWESLLTSHISTSSRV